MNQPETRYAKTDDDLSIADQTVGDGTTDIVFVPFITCVDMMWEEPSLAYALQRLAGVGWLITHLRPTRVRSLPTATCFMGRVMSRT